MRWKNLLLILVNLFFMSLLLLYWMNPGGDSEFTINLDPNTNFSVANNSVKIQFYENMRFPDKMISYKINPECSLPKIHSMERAFEHIASRTNLVFYQVESEEEVTVRCQDRVVIDNGMFIAGEGGPTNITDGDRFRVILHGDILLIKESECANPNVEIHELLHVLGFDHSENKKNIMYPVSKCNQEVGEEIPKIINDLYEVPSKADLKFESVSAEINGRVLDINLSIRNDGLKESENSTIKIMSENKTFKEIPLKSLKLGHGVFIELKNLWITKIKIEELSVVIDNDFDELSKDNNVVLLSKQNN